MQSELRKGSIGDEVKQLQILLNSKLQSITKIIEDGVFGPATDKLIKKFQAINNLGIDGVVGKKTWAVLLGENKTEAKPAAQVPVTASSPWMSYAKNEVNQKR